MESSNLYNHTLILTRKVLETGKEIGETIFFLVVKGEITLYKLYPRNLSWLSSSDAASATGSDLIPKGQI